jgi:transcriptional regulator with GAF, ATPase, and Fis domain
MLNEVCRFGKPFVSAHVQTDPRLPEKRSAALEKVGTVLCAPLKVAGRTVGVLYADHSQPAGSLDESTISFFSAFCNLAAVAIDNALAHRHLVQEKNELEQHLHRSQEKYPEIIGASASVSILRDRIALVAAAPLDVLIWGESGTGKELVARAIYRTGRRSAGNFIALDCGALSDTLIESELFGYRKGAFTGANENRAGLLEAAHGGVLFLDEISNLNSKLQAKLLRVLQEREVRRLGETTTRRIDVQVIAATNRNLKEEIRKGEFRRDLYYRLNAMDVRVPPLRERLEDVPLLLQ